MRVLVFGTFDILHKGHDYFLNNAKKLGDELVVVLARDNTVEIVKGKKSQNSEIVRKNNLLSLGIADKVLLGNDSSDKYAIIEEVNPNIIVLGYDQVKFADKLEEELVKRKLVVKIVRLDSFMPEKYKSSLFRDYS